MTIGFTEWSRRSFMGFLASSPLLHDLPAWMRRAVQDPVITSPGQAINVFDFERAAAARLPAAHFGYMATGVDDDATLRANREGFARLQLRARRLIDVSRVDTSVTLFGQRMETPIVIAPCGSQRAFHPSGELATAGAARARNHLMMLSSMTTTSVEEVTRARGAPIWYQLYPTTKWEVGRAMLRRAEAAGSPVVVLTVDLNAGSNRETLARAVLRDPRECASCHGGAPLDYFKRKPMFDGVDLTGASFDTPEMNWGIIPRIREATRAKVVVKGIVTREDATLCLEHGVDGVVVSNHGGRGEESGRSSIEALPEVVEAIGGRIPVLVDGGIRRGTDIVKALALGATAVGIGRPYLWGLGAFGQAGVERVLELLRAELITAMGHVGATSVASVTPSAISRPAR